MIKPASVSVVLLSFCFFACNNSAVDKKLKFYYYPSRSIYYDVANTQFVFSVNGGKSWEVFKKELGNEPATLGSKIVFYSDSTQPWLNNAENVKTYNGKVYNIADADTSMQSDEASNKKIAKVKPVTPSQDDTAPKKEKKPGFFKRLFGKKN